MKEEILEIQRQQQQQETKETKRDDFCFAEPRSVSIGGNYIIQVLITCIISQSTNVRKNDYSM